MGSIQKKKFIKILGVAFIALLTCLTFLIYATQQQQDIVIEIAETQPVDIVLVKSKTQVDLSNFNEDLRTELLNKKIMNEEDINSLKLKLTTVEAQIQETQSSFNWTEDINTSVGSLEKSNYGKNIIMSGKLRSNAKNAIWVIPNGNQEQTFNFHYNVNYGKTFNAAGMLLRVKRTGNYLEGYMLSFNNLGSAMNLNSNNTGALWKFKYEIGSNTTSFTVGQNGDLECLASFDIATSGDLTVKVTDTDIKISGGNLSEPVEYTMPDNEKYGNGYGFFVDQYRSNSGALGSFTIEGLDLKIGLERDLADILESQSSYWRSGAKRIFINVEDSINTNLSNDTYRARIRTRLLNDDVHFIEWGTSDNKTQMEQLIQSNSNKGLFIYNTSANRIAETAEYVKSIATLSSTHTVLANNHVNITVKELGEEISLTQPSNVWTVTHDNTYYENDEGQYEQTGIATNTLISTFEKVGKYNIYYKNRLISEIYAHRLPVASFDMELNGQNLKLTSTSYDLDIEKDNQIQTGNYGIESELWEYQKEGDSTWQAIVGNVVRDQLEINLDDDSDYNIRLTVTDYQGATSEIVKQVTTKTTPTVPKPIARFTVIKDTLTQYEDLEIVDLSSDPTGIPLSQLTHEWKVLKGTEEKYSGSLSGLSLNNWESGAYTIRLVVSKTVDGQVIESDPYTVDFNIVDDVTPPSIIVTPSSARSSKIDITIKLSDVKGLTSYQYVFNADNNPASTFTNKFITGTPTTYNETITWSAEDVVPSELNTPMYLHIKATNASNISTEERVIGPYYIEQPYELTIQAYDKTTNTRVSNAKFDIIGELGNGSSINLATDCYTDSSNGKIVISNAKLQDVTKIKIRNTDTAPGYQIAEEKYVVIDTAQRHIELDVANSSDDITADTSNDALALTVRVPLEKAKFNLNITNKDSNDNLISGATFILKRDNAIVGTGVVEDGQLALKGDVIGPNKIGFYILEQTFDNNNYIPIKPTTLNITFDENGNISRVVPVLSVDSVVANGTELTVYNVREDESKFDVNIKVSDYVTGQAIENSEYKIKVEGENDIEYITSSAVTDSNGNLKIEGLYGRGKLKLYFIHESPASGYTKENIDRYITITRNDDGQIALEQLSSVGGVFDRYEYTDKTLYVNLTNSHKPITNSIKIRVVLKNDASAGIEGVGVNIKNAITQEAIGHYTTDANGFIEILGIAPSTSGDITYQLIPDNFDIIKSAFMFSVTYDGTGTITGVKDFSNNEDIHIYKTEDDEVDLYKNTANVDIKIERAIANGTKKFIITAIDSKDNQTTIEGAQYKVQIIGIRTYIDTYTTNSNGQIEIELPDEGTEMKIIVQETGKIYGYATITEPKTIHVDRYIQDGTLTFDINKSENVYINDVTKDSDGNIHYKATKKSLETLSVIFNLGATSPNGLLNLSGISYKITEETTGYTQTVVTNADGYVTVDMPFLATEAKTYQFKIDQQNEIFPYVEPDPIYVNIILQKNDIILELFNVEYSGAAEYIFYKNADYTRDDNTVVITLNIGNKKGTDHIDGTVYAIDLKKVDINGNVLDGSKYDVEVRPYALPNLRAPEILVLNPQIEIDDLVMRDNKTTVILKETQPAQGYNLDYDAKVVTLTIDADGNIGYEPATTSSQNIKVTPKVTIENGQIRNVVEILLIAEENIGGSGGPGGNGGSPTNPTDPTDPGDPTDPNNPTLPTTLSFNIHNRYLGSWKHTYRLVTSKGYGYNWRWFGTTTYDDIPADYVGAQKLLRIFDIDGTGVPNGFEFIKGSEIKVEARLIGSDGMPESDIYETTNAVKLSNPSNPVGTHKVYLHKTYAGKEVEFTITQTVAAMNTKRNVVPIKLRIKFDANGKVKNGQIAQGDDLKELAVGGISAGGVTENISVITRKYIDIRTNVAPPYEYPPSITRRTYNLNNYNCIGKDVITLGLLNERLDNPLSVVVNLKDKDTDEGINGPVSLMVTDITTGTSKVLEQHTATVTNGQVKIKLNNTYGDRTLLFTLCQTAAASKDDKSYLNNTSAVIQFVAKIDTDGKIIANEFETRQLPDCAVFNKALITEIEYTIYNDIIYNFAINLTKLDVNGEPLPDVRVRSTTYMMDNVATNQKHQVFKYGSALTDENGNVKLKIVLPSEPNYNYLGKTFEVNLDEYYVPEDYRAQTGMKVRILFVQNGEMVVQDVIDEKIPDSKWEDSVNFTGINTKDPNATGPNAQEKNSVDLAMNNSIITDKPYVEITNVDLDDRNIKLEGSQYEVRVMDSKEYAIGSLTYSEIKETNETGADGLASAQFEHAHALRTMIYVIHQMKTADSYIANEDIAIRVKYDEEGKIVSTPEVLNQREILDCKNTPIKMVSIIGNPIGSEKLQLQIVNELKPKFTVKIDRKDTDGNIMQGKSFKVVLKEKDQTGEYNTVVEERMSNETYDHQYEIGFKTDPKSKEFLYEIYEKTGNEFTLRGQAEVVFDIYGNTLSSDVSGKYITGSTRAQKELKVKIVAEIFKMNILVVDKDNAGYDLSGYSFKITNNKGEVSDTTVKTNSTGRVLEIIGEVYKDEVITYTIEQANSALEYKDIPSFDLEISFDINGRIISCTPNEIQNLYKLITTDRDNTTGINMQIKIFTTQTMRNSIKISVVDEDDANKNINTIEYDVTISNSAGSTTTSRTLNVVDGEGETDLGTYKLYKERTVLYTLKQSDICQEYMINDTAIQISVTYDVDGLITEARIISSDGYVTIDDAATIGTSQLVLNTKNKRKTEMQLIAQNIGDETDKIDGAKFKIIEVGKSDLYSDTKMTNPQGTATLYVGPYYRDTNVTYKITNIQMNKEYQKIPETQFTIHYNADGKVDAVDSANLPDYLEIKIPTSGTADIEITVKVTPAFTVGIDAVNANGDRLVGGKYDVVKVSTTISDEVITNQYNTAHAGLGAPGKLTTIQYNIIEKTAPLGCKYKNINNVIAKLYVNFNSEGQIIGTPQLDANVNYKISLNQPTDKLPEYDVDIKIEYEEAEEFTVVIDNHEKIGNAKIESTFTGVLSGISMQPTTTTDPVLGLGSLTYSKMTKSERELTITQSNIQGNYSAIAPIKLKIDFDESGKIISVTPVNGSDLATENVSYKINTNSAIGGYVLNIEVMNNPYTKIQLKNYEDGTTNNPVSSTHVLSAEGMNSITMKAVLDPNANVSIAEAILENVPKSTTVQYTLRQTNVPAGYKVNKDIRLIVRYNADGIITDAYISTGVNYADSSVVEINSWSDYGVELIVKNKAEFNIVLTAKDEADPNITLSDVSVTIEETTYSHDITTMVTDATGEAREKLGSTYAGQSLTYRVEVNNNLPGYDVRSRSLQGDIIVEFNNEGTISNITSTNSQIEAVYGSPLGIQVTVNYKPVLKMDISRQNTTTGQPISDRKMTITSTAINSGYVLGNAGYFMVNTNAQGKIHLSDAGIIEKNTTVTYKIEEDNTTNYTVLEQLGILEITVTYDDNGYINSYSSNMPDKVNLDGIGTRNLKVEIGSSAHATIGLVNVDKYIPTNRISGAVYEIKAEGKGETMTISPTSGANVAIEQLGKIYPGETIKYTIHQTTAVRGFKLLDDVQFEVEYNQDGSIGNVTSLDPDFLIVGNTYQVANESRANINLELRSMPNLLVKIKVKDLQYITNGVENIGFEITDLNANQTTALTNNKTNANGVVEIPVYQAYENTIVRYRIRQTDTYGGYDKMIDPFELQVCYGPNGVINEAQTFILGSSDATLTQRYSENLFAQEHLRGIEVNLKLETKFGIGIEKVDLNGNPMESVRFNIYAEDLSNGLMNSTTTAPSNANGEIANYDFGELPKNKIIRYTIHEVEAPVGYRTVEDAVIEVQFDNNGKILGWTPVSVPQNVNVEINVASTELKKLSNSREAVHIKLKVENDNRITFRILNLQNVTDKYIKDSEISVSLTTSAGTIINNETRTTNINGEILLNNIDGTGIMELHFNQLSVPDGIQENTANRGIIKIIKTDNPYKLEMYENNSNFVYDLDSVNGVVTVYLYNDNDLTFNILDVDAQTLNPTTGATHTIIAQVGELTDTADDITIRNDNIVTYNSGLEYISNNASTLVHLGSTYNFRNKRVVFTISTPIPATNYNPIGKAKVIIDFDQNGEISSIDSGSPRTLEATKDIDTYLRGNIVIGFGEIDFYRIVVEKEDSNTKLPMNDVNFDISIKENGGTRDTITDVLTGDKLINDVIVDSGVILSDTLDKLKYEGNIEVTITEKSIPEYYHTNILNIPITVSFNVTLDKTGVEDDPNVAKLIVDRNSINANGLKLFINENSREIRIKVENNPFIKFNLHKKDEYGNSLAQMQFDVKVQERGTMDISDIGTHSTDANGNIELNIDNKYAGKNVLIILNEIKQYEYKQINPIVVEAYIQPDGKIKDDSVSVICDQLATGENNTQVVDITENSISVTVTNELEEYVKPYSIAIKKVDSKDHTIKLSNVIFHAYIVPEIGIPMSVDGMTDANGKLVFRNLTGSGKIKVELTEVNTPNGYKTPDYQGNPGYIYEFTKIDDSLQKERSSCPDALWEMDNNNKVVNITVENELEKIGLAFEKVDEKNTQLRIEGAKYVLTFENGETIEATSNRNGIIYFAVDKVLTNEPIRLTISESVAPQGYELSTDIHDLEIQCDPATGKIASVSSDLEILTQEDEYVKFRITDEQKYIGVDPYNIELIDVDAADGVTPIKGSVFDININNRIGVLDLSVIDQTTHANGYIDTITNVNGAGEIKITIENTKAGDGYEQNLDETYVKVYRDPQTGAMVIDEARNVGADIDPNTNTIKVIYYNRKEANKYALKVNVIDAATGNPITDTNASYKLDINGSSITKNIDSFGRIILNGLTMPNINTYDIIISEEQKPAGVDSITDDQTATVTLANVYDRRVIVDTTTSGDHIEKKTVSMTLIELNVFYGKKPGEGADSGGGSGGGEGDKLYLTSDIYSVDADEGIISRVIAETNDLVGDNIGIITMKEFIENLNTNATKLEIYDKDNNLVETYDVERDGSGKLVYNGSNANKIATSMTIKAIKGNQDLNYGISVVGDINGDGVIDLTDNSMVSEHLVAEMYDEFGIPREADDVKLLSDLYSGKDLQLRLLASEINNDGVIDLTDNSIISEHLVVEMYIQFDFDRTGDTLQSITEKYMMNV